MNIHGRVQGVFFRDSTKRRAKKEGVFGYVRNLDNGSVEVVAEGEEENLEELMEWCKKGPFLAKVSKVEAEWEDYKGEFNSFKIEYA